VKIQLEHGNALEAMGNHLLFVDGKTVAVRADSIQVGDVLRGATVTKADNVQSPGLYAPLTPSGFLIVNGVMASNYISLEKADSHALLGQNVHAFFHLGISPFHLLCNGASSGMCGTFTEAGIPVLLDAALRSFEWMMDLPQLFQALAIVAWLAIAIMTWTMEFVLLAPVTCVVVSSVSLFAATRGSNWSVRINPKTKIA
jgi:Hint module